MQQLRLPIEIKKQNQNITVCNITINYQADKALNNRKNYIFIFSWNYSNEIYLKVMNNKLCNLGVIIPLPEFTIKDLNYELQSIFSHSGWAKVQFTISVNLVAIGVFTFQPRFNNLLEDNSYLKSYPFLGDGAITVLGEIFKIFEIIFTISRFEISSDPEMWNFSGSFDFA